MDAESELQETVMRKKYPVARLLLHIALVTLPSVLGVALGMTFVRDHLETTHGLVVPQFFFFVILLGAELAVIKLLSGDILRLVYGSNES